MSALHNCSGYGRCANASEHLPEQSSSLVVWPLWWHGCGDYDVTTRANISWIQMTLQLNTYKPKESSSNETIKNHNMGTTHRIEAKLAGALSSG